MDAVCNLQVEVFEKIIQKYCKRWTFSGLVKVLFRLVQYIIVRAFPKGKAKKIGFLSTLSYSVVSRTIAVLQVPLFAGVFLFLGRDPFNQNFWKFRSKTEWISSAQLEKFRKNRSTFWGGPLFPVGPVRWKRTVPLILTIPTHSQSQYLADRYFPWTTWGKTFNHCSFYGLLTADLSLLFVHLCAVTTGVWLLRGPSVCFDC